MDQSGSVCGSCWGQEAWVLLGLCCVPSLELLGVVLTAQLGRDTALPPQGLLHDTLYRGTKHTVRTSWIHRLGKSKLCCSVPCPLGCAVQLFFTISFASNSLNFGLQCCGGSGGTQVTQNPQIFCLLSIIPKLIIDPFFGTAALVPLDSWAALQVTMALPVIV